MKIAFIHYNIGEEGGVNSVMRINAITLKKLIKNVQISFIGSYMGKIIDGKGFHYTDLPELGITQKRISDFSSMNVSQYIKMGDKIYDKLVKCTKDIDHVIIENPIRLIHICHYSTHHQQVFHYLSFTFLLLFFHVLYIKDITLCIYKIILLHHHRFWHYIHNNRNLRDLLL